MNQKGLRKLIISDWIIWVLLIITMIGLYYHGMIVKNTFIQIVESILFLCFSCLLIFLRRIKLRFKNRTGLLKVYGEKVGSNSISLINLGFGIIWVIFGFLDYKDINGLIFKVTVGFGYFIASFLKWRRYYVQISDKRIIQLDSKFMEIRDIKSIVFLGDKIEIKSTNRTIEILFSEINDHDRQYIIDDFETIKLKYNLN
ncbi:MAG: hypothetical protein PHV20_08510 [Bacteroidales bacterium]|nr:hypothetical protein [Bacteroidales bacterium]